MLSGILKLLNGLLNNNSSFKIIETSAKLANKKTTVTYQLNNTPMLITGIPEKIIKDLLRLKGFSIEECDEMYKLALDAKNNPDLCIKGIFFEYKFLQF